MTQAYPIAFPMLDNSSGITDCYIDDLRPICVDIEDNAERCAAVVALTIDVFDRPLGEHQPLPWDVLLPLTKFTGEGMMADLKTILGSLIDSHLLLISLMEETFTSWSQDLQKMIQDKKCLTKFLEMTVGRLEHDAHIIPDMRHFLSRLRKLKDRAVDLDLRYAHFGGAIIEDLTLHVDFLKQARDGISLNLLSHRDPTKLNHSDTCPLGLGGYSLMSAHGWCWMIPKHLIFRLTLNTLEYLGCMMCV
jgi:hypothetical protein